MKTFPLTLTAVALTFTGAAWALDQNPPTTLADRTVAAIAEGPVPTQAEVTAARGACHDHKVRALAMEDQVSETDPALKQAYRAWENHCAIAQALMDRRAGRPVLQAELPPVDDTQTAAQ